jgi:hypothetical protein
MNRARRWRGRLAGLALLCGALTCGHGAEADSALVKKLFRNPPRDSSTGPLWVWNDLLTEEQIRSTLRDLAAQRIQQVWVHPRPGLMTPYLSEDWFRLWRVALDEARRLDMNVWIYDENSYPSGFAGGWVPEQRPDACGRGLSVRETNAPPVWNEHLIAVLRVEGDRAENVTDRVQSGHAPPSGRYFVATELRAANTPWTAGRCYVDLLQPGVTETFLEITLEPYRHRFGAEFGRRIPGVFTDEPNLHSTSGWPWTSDLPQQFQQRRGYDLIEHLPALVAELGDWKRVRHDYWRTVHELFIERWARPYFEYCASNGLELTGHYWEHEWPRTPFVPDNMAMAAWQQRPGIDILMNQYAEHTHAQFGNVRACREIASLANQLGRRTLVELYGAAGWDLRFEDMKRIGDWLQVLGVNTLNQHLSFITIRGARKRDHPQSFSYHEPWWPAYHVSAQYFARLSAALSRGEQIHRILVLEPTTTAWMYQGNEPKLTEIGDAFFNLLLALEAAQIEYDLGCETVLADHGAVEGRQLRVGRRAYDAVVLPPLTETLNAETCTLLGALAGRGGDILLCDDRLSRVNGALPDANDTRLRWSERVERVPAVELPKRLARVSEADGFRIRRASGDRGRLFHMRRQLADGQLLFLVNTSDEFASAGEIHSPLRGVERWDAYTGAVAPYPFERPGDGVRARFALPPSGSLLLFLSEKPLRPAPGAAERRVPIPPRGPVEIRRLEPNVLTLDYVDVTVGGETRSNSYFYAAQQWVFQKHGLPRNPWDNAVQFKDEFLAKTFPPESGFTVGYTFTIEGRVPTNLALVIERPDLYRITCNDRPVRARPGAWWLDKAFGVVPLAEVARPGRNVVTLRAQPFTVWHELEPAYLLGDFALRPTERGFVVAPERELQLGAWNEQGHPFYARGVAYRQQFEVTDRKGRFVVSLGRWRGSVARVSVNGKFCGWLDAPPWECDVTRHVRRGANTVEIVVLGTLKNTLGPHHGDPPLGAAWPAQFHVGPSPGPPPGASYSTVGYGLFEPWAFEHVLPAGAR